MARPRTPLSSYGAVSLVEVEPGKWRARTRYRFDDGRLRQVERFATSRAKAETKLKAALVDIQLGAGVDVKRETRIRDLGRRFLEAKAGRAPRTLDAYRHTIDRVIVPRIGDLAVSEATTDRLQRFIDLVARENGPGAAKTARAVLSGMMGLAARSDAIRTNPVRELAAVEGKAKGAIQIPLDELSGLLETVRADERLAEVDMTDLVLFVAGTGVRIGEACNLVWTGVDLEKGTVTIGDAKTDAGERCIRVPAGVVGMLTERRVKGGLNLDGVVFPTVLGKRRDPRRAAAEWADFRKRHNLPGYTFHSFRKTVATALDQAGLTPRDIAEYLGHADPSLTMGVYMSKTVGGTRAADALDSVLRN
ncbi:integrase [Microbacterium sp. AK009]|uniref:tyrosine-type recombinase/integrase n=1 Tax=Microbacterium sp. AK009 TaxID=2723068 RepID=UPI0015CEEA9C|nr:site-specific integrase [Microbacterium sp. AK009]NYF17527.1 integrase [Microbacterium sp. AK009]